MKESTKAMMAGMVIGLAGSAVIIHELGWIAFFGIFLLLWGNNIVEGIRRTNETREEAL